MGLWDGVGRNSQRKKRTPAPGGRRPKGERAREGDAFNPKPGNRLVREQALETVLHPLNEAGVMVAPIAGILHHPFQAFLV